MKTRKIFQNFKISSFLLKSDFIDQTTIFD